MMRQPRRTRAGEVTGAARARRRVRRAPAAHTIVESPKREALPHDAVEAALVVVPERVERVLPRADSALYEQTALRMPHARGVGFGISADMTPELRAACMAAPDEAWLRYLALRFERLFADGSEEEHSLQRACPCGSR
jgi:hypothetical protein